MQLIKIFDRKKFQKFENWFYAYNKTFKQNRKKFVLMQLFFVIFIV